MGRGHHVCGEGAALRLHPRVRTSAQLMPQTPHPGKTLRGQGCQEEQDDGKVKRK